MVRHPATGLGLFIVVLYAEMMAQNDKPILCTLSMISSSESNGSSTVSILASPDYFNTIACIACGEGARRPEGDITFLSIVSKFSESTPAGRWSDTHASQALRPDSQNRTLWRPTSAVFKAVTSTALQ
jgi:hypothetical protein